MLITIQRARCTDRLVGLCRFRSTDDFNNLTVASYNVQLNLENYELFFANKNKTDIPYEQ